MTFRFTSLPCIWGPCHASMMRQKFSSLILVLIRYTRKGWLTWLVERNMIRSRCEACILPTAMSAVREDSTRAIPDEAVLSSRILGDRLLTHCRLGFNKFVVPPETVKRTPFPFLYSSFQVHPSSSTNCHSRHCVDRMLNG